MVFILGLGTRLKNIPFATLAIILLCTAHYHYLNNLKQVDEALLLIHQEFNESDEVIKLFDEYLVEEGLPSNLEASKDAWLAKLSTLNQTRKKKYNRPKNFNLIKAKDSGQDKLNRDKKVIPFFFKIREGSSELMAFESYDDFALKQQEYFQQLHSLYSEHNLLSYGSVSFMSVLNAIFTHAGLGHLVGNMMFLFIFGVYVEQRMGHLQYLLGYLIFGSLGIALYTLTNNEGTPIYVVGASANVSAVMGMFYMAFFHHKMRLYAGYLVFGRTFYVSIKKYFLILFVAQDLIMSLTPGSRIAHLAHLLGFIFGVGGMIIWDRLYQLPNAFIYPFEFELWNKIKEKVDQDYFTGVAQILKYNPNNWLVKNATMEVLFQKLSHKEKLSMSMTQLFHKIIPYYTSRTLKEREDVGELFKRLAEIDSVHLGTYFLQNSRKEILTYIDLALDREEYLIFIHFSHTFFIKYPRSRKLNKLALTINSVVETIEFDEKEIEMINRIYYGSKSHKFRENLRLILDQNGVLYAQG